MSQLIRHAVAIVFLMAALSLPAFGQQDDVSVTEKMQQMQSLVRTELRQILQDEMMLTEAESKTFWPLYERYSAESRVITDRYLEVVTEFAERYYAGQLSDDDANRLLDEYFARRLAVAKLRQSYVAGFREVLRGIKVTRFYQLENKLLAEVDAAFAAAIPLADPR